MDGVSKDFETEAAQRDDSEPNKAELAMTLHQLRIFHALANAKTMTSAAKQLGFSQPSLSQQLGRLEAAVGTRLFERRPNEMALTEAGRYLLPRVEQMLRILNDTKDGLGRFQKGYQSVIKVAGIDSALRSLLPRAVRRLERDFPDFSLDIQESAPADILDLLYSRRIHFGLVAANSLAPTHAHFLQIPIKEDPYVLAVPEELDLSGITDPARQLTPTQFRMLNRSIHFEFGSSHGRRINDWYDRLLSDHKAVAHCRTFETALSLVRAGTGVCLAPALSTVCVSGQTDSVRRYLIDLPPRRVVALLLSHNKSMEPMATLIDALQEGGRAVSLPKLLPTPPFLVDGAAAT